jgi:site-specific DNA-cytosine methylase
MNSRVYSINGISPTLNAGNSGGGQSPVKHLTDDYSIRKLTPRECFRLQDFDDTFKFVVSNSQLYKQAGNSISVNISEMIFRQIELSRSENMNKNSLF